jgi:hypothetical protein
VLVFCGTPLFHVLFCLAFAASSLLSTTPHPAGACAACVRVLWLRCSFLAALQLLPIPITGVGVFSLGAWVCSGISGRVAPRGNRLLAFGRASAVRALAVVTAPLHPTPPNCGS